MYTLGIQNYGLLIVISCLWGSQFLFNNLALQVWSPLWIATLRALLGATTLTVLLPIYRYYFGRKINNICLRRYWSVIFAIAALEVTLPFLLVVWGQQFINSSLTAVLLGTIPIFTALIVLLFSQKESVSWGIAVSIGLGFVGLLVLFGPVFFLQQTYSVINIKGQIAVLGGAVAFATSLVLIKKLNPADPVMTARDILFCGAIQLYLLLILNHEHLPANITFYSIVALLMLGIFCTGIVYACYVVLIARAGSTFAAFANYLVPVVGVMLGVLVLHEKLFWYQTIAMGIIIAALITNGLFKKNYLRRERLYK
ncbi:MAG: EamA family transporter [Gammaproteobacteria bacterium]